MEKVEASIVISTQNNKTEQLTLDIQSVLYVTMKGNYAHIHMANGTVYQTRMKFSELQELLGDYFIRLSRGTLVSAMAIHNVTQKVNLCNGEALDYVAVRKNEIFQKIREKQEKIIRSFQGANIPKTMEEYKAHYRVFDTLPFAFTDIEMVFDQECHAIDWIFRYGNAALAELEKLPLEKLLGSSFGGIFPNMDDKWLQNYERATLYGDTLKMVDYSPEIDTYLEVICFPTFPGHCGCILFDVSQIQFFRKSTETEQAMALFIDKMLRGC